MRQLLAALVVSSALVVAPAVAQNAKNPINITADNFVIDESVSLATFTGKVVLVRKDLTLWADKVVVDYGAGGPSDIKSFVATGKVRIKTSEQDATGDRADYDPRKETLRMTGNVMVVNASSTVGSADLVVDLNTNKSTFSGGRVTGVFTPK